MRTFSWILFTCILATSNLACTSSSDKDESDEQFLFSLLLASSDQFRDISTLIYLTARNDWQTSGTVASAEVVHPEWPADLLWTGEDGFAGFLDDLFPEVLGIDVSAATDASEARDAIDDAINDLVSEQLSSSWTFSISSSRRLIINQVEDDPAISYPRLENSFNGAILGIRQIEEEAIEAGEIWTREGWQGSALLNPQDIRFDGAGLTWTFSIHFAEGLEYPTAEGPASLDEDLELRISIVLNNWSSESAMHSKSLEVAQ